LYVSTLEILQLVGLQIHFLLHYCQLPFILHFFTQDIINALLSCIKGKLQGLTNACQPQMKKQITELYLSTKLADDVPIHSAHDNAIGWLRDVMINHL